MRDDLDTFLALSGRPEAMHEMMAVWAVAAQGTNR